MEKSRERFSDRFGFDHNAEQFWVMFETADRSHAASFQDLDSWNVWFTEKNEDGSEESFFLGTETRDSRGEWEAFPFE